MENIRRISSAIIFVEYFHQILPWHLEKYVRLYLISATTSERKMSLNYQKTYLVIANNLKFEETRFSSTFFLWRLKLYLLFNFHCYSVNAILLL